MFSCLFDVELLGLFEFEVTPDVVDDEIKLPTMQSVIFLFV